MTNRREVLGLFAGIVAACGCGQAHAQSANGCFLSSAGAGVFASEFDLRLSTGDLFMDQIVPMEANFLANRFQVAPGFFYFLEPADMGKNALATPRVMTQMGQAGTVLLGLNLMRSEMQSPWWGAALAGIMAHEWAHIRQQNAMLTAPTPRKELHADYLAGWHLGLKEHVQPGFVAIQGLAQSLFNLGDYDFTNPNHHGTPQQRVQAMQAGFMLGFQGVFSIDAAYQRGWQLLGG